MTWREACEAFYKAAKNPKKCKIGFWVGPDGIFHNNWKKYNFSSVKNNWTFKKEISKTT